MAHDSFDFPSGSFIGGDDAMADYMSFDHSVDFGFNLPSFEPINATPHVQVPVDSNVQTVSPRDVFKDYTSAPPSSVLTNLSTPGTFSMDSPYMTHSTDTSPLYADDALEADADSWAPLFGTDNSVTDEQHTLHAQSAVRSSVETVPTPSPMTRHRSSPGKSTSRGSHGRHSSVSGVNARKRDKPLPPITVEDPNDVVAVKRARNTAAARKSRDKKKKTLEELEELTAQLKDEVAYWKDVALGKTTV